MPFTSICGIPVHWLRWGRTGRRFIDESWLPILESSLEPLVEWFNPSGWLAAGAWVPKPGRHRLGTAFDLCGFMRPGMEWSLVAQWDRDPAVAIGVEATLRIGLPQVLGPMYDDRHKDHWHLDDNERAVGFSPKSHADVSFLQWALLRLWGCPLEVDGVWGPATRLALAKTGHLGGGEVDWDGFLIGASMRGLESGEG